MSSREEKNKEIRSKLEHEEKKEKRIKLIKLILKIFIVFFIIILILLFYIDYSSSSIITKEKRIRSDKIPTSMNGIKIIQFSDLDYGSTIFKSEVKNLVKIINIRKPDIVIFTGNLIDTNYKIKTKEQEELTKELQKINTTMGKYAVSGKNDKESFNTIMNQSDFTILNNEYDLIYKNDNNPILIVGLSSLINNTREIDKAYSYFKEETHNSEIYTISIMSETDGLDNILSSYNNDLVLAGNSLNGQIRLPFIGGIITRDGSKKYKDEYYKINNTEIFVSSGISSLDIGFRLFNHPSINLFRLTNNKRN